ncbi:mannosyltransferase PIG-M [Nitzschia inconspicua]|uniref:GPI mannosyltransferase 1 n=1 Tax=Nitzschia inconspicua TaxID=303405 RepID=A0A9K3KTF2_9STRA|nr:mannosyltransferase PIG-M [Nitzschia inconspicua]
MSQPPPRENSDPPWRILSSLSNPAYSPWIGLFFRLFLAWILPFLLDDGRLIPGLSYTDIDFLVFTDAAKYIQQGQSPYDRHTYRYTPFLAGLLAKFPHREVGRYLFCVADALCGWIILSLRQSQAKKDGNNIENWKVGLGDALWWLYNPLAINICTRGSSESLMVLLPVLATFWVATLNERTESTKQTTADSNASAATVKQVFWTGICHGIAVHSKLYPIIYSLSYMAYFATPPRTRSKTIIYKTNRFPWNHPVKLFRLAMLWIQRLLSPLPMLFLLTFAVTFVVLTWLAVRLYGNEALHEGLLYHFGRIDHRHNYSMYWYWIYLARARASSVSSAMATLTLSRIGKILLLPQAFLLAYSSLGMGPNPNQLGLTLFVQTYLFVSHNKVITAQYFTWYLCLLPLCSRQIQLQSREVLVAVALLGLSIVAWLGSAYLLEMQGMSVHRIVWACSVAYFFANVNVLTVVLQSRIPKDKVKESTMQKKKS